MDLGLPSQFQMEGNQVKKKILIYDDEFEQTKRFKDKLEAGS